MKLELVEWVDSNSCSGNWNSRQAIMKRPPGGMLIRSVGWVVQENRETIVVVPHLTYEENDTFGSGKGDITIPKVAIVSRKPLWENP